MTRRFDPAEIPPAPDLRFESALWAKDIATVAGVDEAGRGCWAGPVAAGAVIFPPRVDLLELLPGIRDSKQMPPADREICAQAIQQHAAAWAVGFASNTEIDTIGIIPATRLAMTRAIAGLKLSPSFILIDAVRLPDLAISQTSLIKGDARALSIAAASILAKTSRDARMRQLDEEFPGYGFARHKGYGTAFHREALNRLGLCQLHRRSFMPVKQAEARLERNNDL